MTPLIETAPEDLHLRATAELARHYGISEPEALDWVKDAYADTLCFINETYFVELTPTGLGALLITIRRKDGGIIKDWRDFQEIKNQLAGEEREAVELYPAESRKVDTSNKWHLFVLPEGVKFDFGWPERDVRYDGDLDIPGMQQRPL
jgi:hypothetical protein